MRLGGLQKLTLLDFPGHVACTVFTPGCNFRCPFCHNTPLVTGTDDPDYPIEDFFRFLKTRQGILDGVAITGGEPLLRRELPELLRAIRDLGYPIKLDTNGSHPERLRQIVEEGLADYVAMDVKNRPERYAETAGLSQICLDGVRESVEFLLHGSVDYEFRTTLVDELHEVEDVRCVAQWISGAKRYFLQPFADRDTVAFEGFHAPSEEKLRRCLEAARIFVPAAQIRGV